MKLHEIAKARPVIKEGMVEPNLMMSVQNIINRGRADNHFEYICVARLIQLLHDGNFYKTSNPIFDGNLSTSKELLDHLRALPPAEMKELAEKLWIILQIKDKDALADLANQNQEYLEYLAFIRSREAND
jgi:hypothetical protein